MQILPTALNILKSSKYWTMNYDNISIAALTQINTHESAPYVEQK